MAFLDAYAASEDKATVKDMILARRYIPDDLERMSVDQLRSEVRRLRRLIIDMAGMDTDTLRETVQRVKTEMGETGLPPIPFCAFEGTRPIWERYAVLVWVRAKRDNPQITLEEVQERLPATDPEALSEITNELLYFFTQATREDIQRFNAVPVEEGDNTEKKAQSDVNPTD